MTQDTKNQLLDLGLRLFLERGYHDLGIQTLLSEAGVPKGSFYHFFSSKEQFALEVVDRYMEAVHAGLTACLTDASQPPLQRIRNFFTATEEKYRQDGYLGCMLGGLGQELSGVNEVFRHKIEDCFGQIAERIARCFDEAARVGDLPASFESARMANLLVNCWEGAALRSRLGRSPEPLQETLDFYFRAAGSP